MPRGKDGVPNIGLLLQAKVCTSERMRFAGARVFSWSHGKDLNRRVRGHGPSDCLLRTHTHTHDNNNNKEHPSRLQILSLSLSPPVVTADERIIKRRVCVN